MFACDAGLSHIVVIKLPWVDGAHDAVEDPASLVCQTRAWCTEQVPPDAWNLRYTPGTLYVRFAHEADAVLCIDGFGDSYRKQPTPRTGPPRRNPWLEARMALAAEAEAKAEAEWED